MAICCNFRLIPSRVINLTPFFFVNISLFFLFLANMFSKVCNCSDKAMSQTSLAKLLLLGLQQVDLPLLTLTHKVTLLH